MSEEGRGLEELAAAFLCCCIRDARDGSPVGQEAREAARLILLSDRPEWAESRRMWFAAARVEEPARWLIRRAIGLRGPCYRAAVERARAALGAYDGYAR